MMNAITCGVCHKVIAYTNRKVSDTKKDFLSSTKISAAQKWAMIKKEKLIYCVACYDEGIAKGRVERELENNKFFYRREQERAKLT